MKETCNGFIMLWKVHIVFWGTVERFEFLGQVESSSIQECVSHTLRLGNINMKSTMYTM